MSALRRKVVECGEAAQIKSTQIVSLIDVAPDAIRLGRSRGSAAAAAVGVSDHQIENAIAYMQTHAYMAFRSFAKRHTKIDTGFPAPVPRF
jgi:hypothetical protein